VKGHSLTAQPAAVSRIAASIGPSSALDHSLQPCDRAREPRVLPQRHALPRHDGQGRLPRARRRVPHGEWESPSGRTPCPPTAPSVLRIPNAVAFARFASRRPSAGAAALRHSATASKYHTAVQCLLCCAHCSTSARRRRCSTARTSTGDRSSRRVACAVCALSPLRAASVEQCSDESVCSWSGSRAASRRTCRSRRRAHLRSTRPRGAATSVG
jgi:hypothetical protein